MPISAQIILTDPFYLEVIYRSDLFRSDLYSFVSRKVTQSLVYFFPFQ